MNKTILWTIIILLVAAAVIFGLWQFFAPAEVMAPTDPSDNREEVVPDNNRPTGQFMQQAPEPDPLLDEEVQEEAVDSEVTISMTDTGFSPASVTVPVGTKVTFVNNGQALHWPASDNHPLHEILPDFDSKRGLNTGESYSYTFTQTGSWGYHDHLNAQLTGTVIVE